MKSKLLLFLIASFPFLLAAQSENKSIREKLESPVYVVLDEDFGEDYNTLIREAMAGWWTLSKYQFIESSELTTLKEDVNHLFLQLVKNEGIDADIREYQQVVTLANYARAGRYRNNVTGAAVDLESSSDARLTIMNGLRLIQEKTRFEMAKAEGEVEELSTWLGPRTSRIKSGTLFMAREDLDMELAELNKIYAGPVDLISSKELAAMMESGGTGSYAFVHGFKISGGYVIEKSILDAKTGELLYYATAGSPGPDGKLGKKDFKSLE